MHYMSKMLVASGLAFMAGPFCLKALAQGYVDVEAERAAAKREAPAAATSSPSAATTTTSPVYGTQPQAAPPDPYATQPAQTYPTTSYGLNNAPAATTAAAPAPMSGDPANVGNLLYQVQQLQQEVMQLNGKIEEQAYEIRTLKEQSLERYVDLDRRVSALAGGGAAAAAVPATGPAPSAAAGGGSAQPGEADAYRAAYALVRGQQFNEAVGAFNQFLRDYPAGKFAPNAHYWLGELYLVVQPPDPESARQSFQLLIDQYPDNAKVPDALYKLGRVHFMKGNRERSREYLDRVIAEYGATGDAAVKLAQDFIAQNF